MIQRLHQIAYARSGDKGDKANIGVVARSPEFYEILLDQVTAQVVKRHFADVVLGDVQRYELPNLNALNFVLEAALDGGGMKSLRLDAQGKTLCDALMLLPVEVPESMSK